DDPLPLLQGALGHSKTQAALDPSAHRDCLRPDPAFPRRRSAGGGFDFCALGTGCESVVVPSAAPRLNGGVRGQGSGVREPKLQYITCDPAGHAYFAAGGAATSEEISSPDAATA